MFASFVNRLDAAHSPDTPYSISDTEPEGYAITGVPDAASIISSSNNSGQSLEKHQSRQHSPGTRIAPDRRSFLHTKVKSGPQTNFLSLVFTRCPYPTP